MRRLADRVFAVGVNDNKRRLFDALIPLPHGTSYNSYLIAGEKTAVIDASDPLFADEWLKNIRETGYKPDYIIANHAEQDHSGALGDFVREYPEAKIVASAKGRDFLKLLLHLPVEKFVLVEDRGTLDLGGGFVLEFYFAPWVHWPETMFTFLPAAKILFSCDFLGAHYASADLYVTDEAEIYLAAKRYYAEIMMPFRAQSRKALELAKKLDPRIVAPSHGQAYNRPEFIFDAYADWTSEETKNALILYVSMHGSVQKMTGIIRRVLEAQGAAARALDLADADLGEVAMELVDARAALIGAPTVLGGAHPAALYAAALLNALRPKTRYIGLYGSCLWGGKALEQLAGLLSNIKPEILPSFLVKGLPSAADEDKLVLWAKDVAAKVN
ncbi:MAG: FprA family A-type flavoprotein [Candidatus Margulisbacteria bacterium]|jgi:flavorubredoxin|nr:FprA family A-type flavoprotein [Candidatus Margulisiibacteriota bacterium]